MFYKFNNFCIYIKKTLGNQNEDKIIEKEFFILKINLINNGIRIKL